MASTFRDKDTCDTAAFLHSAKPTTRASQWGVIYTNLYPNTYGNTPSQFSPKFCAASLLALMVEASPLKSA